MLFNLKKAQEIWKSAERYENNQYPYCTFTWRNGQNQTKLLVGVNYASKQVQVDVDLTTLDCPTLHQSMDKPHQHLMHLGLCSSVIGGVAYDTVTFWVGENDVLDYA